MFEDIFNDDAFSLISLTAAINNVDHVPGRAGELAFAGVGEGVSTTTVSVESRATVLSLIKSQPRGAEINKEAVPSKSVIRSLNIPHIPLEDTVQAASVQNVRAFGTTDQLLGVQTVVNQQVNKMSQRHDLTIENLRLGALKGQVLDADSAVLADLFATFSIENDNSATGDGGVNGAAPVGGGSATDAAPKIFTFDFSESANSEDDLDDTSVFVRSTLQRVRRFQQRVAKMIIPNNALYYVLAGDNWFDALIERPDVKRTYLNVAEQQVRLGNNYAFGVFEYGGFVFENYRGTDDNTTVSVDPDEAICFLTGVPGMYAEYFAPADFMETVNTVGLPRYAKLAPDTKFNRYVEIHTQQNPLPICLRPQTLLRFTKA